MLYVIYFRDCIVTNKISFGDLSIQLTVQRRVGTFFCFAIIQSSKIHLYPDLLVIYGLPNTNWKCIFHYYTRFQRLHPTRCLQMAFILYRVYKNRRTSYCLWQLPALCRISWLLLFENCEFPHITLFLCFSHDSLH